MHVLQENLGSVLHSLITLTRQGVGFQLDYWMNLQNIILLYVYSCTDTCISIPNGNVTLN